MITTVIFKYPVPITDFFELNLPYGSKILSFQVQNGQPVLWVLIDKLFAETTRHFNIVGTGNPCEINPMGDHVFIGTIQLNGLVWHLFELL